MLSEARRALAKATTKSVNQEVLEEIIRRVFQTAQPERIILFGSVARGEMGPNSDLDLLVIKRGKFDQRRLTGDIYVSLHGGQPSCGRDRGGAGAGGETPRDVLEGHRPRPALWSGGLPFLTRLRCKTRAAP